MHERKDIVVSVRVEIKQTLLSPDEWAEMVYQTLTEPNRTLGHLVLDDSIRVVARDTNAFGEMSKIIEKKCGALS